MRRAFPVLYVLQMNISTVRQLAALRPDSVERSATNVHLTATDLTHFRKLAKSCGVNFSGLVRAGLRLIEKAINDGAGHG